MSGGATTRQGALRSVSFSVPGAVPPKSNYRHDGSANMRRLWARIKDYEAEVGTAGMVAGAKRHMNKGVARVYLVLVNQECDIDNATKSPIDGLKRVAYPDDKPRFLRRLYLDWVETPDGRPRADYRIEWKETRG